MPHAYLTFQFHLQPNTSTLVSIKMRMSCNGCRVLRKGCTQNCSIRPCLQWIKTPHSQSNATLFLAKFYGRAGLLNLLNAAPHHLRPHVFRSLLYEACGRIVNPLYGSTGLLWSGDWHICQNAVDAVLRGAPISPAPSPAAACLPSNAYEDIGRGKSGDPLRVRKRFRFKRTGTNSKDMSVPAAGSGGDEGMNGWTSHEYQVSAVDVEPEFREIQSLQSFKIAMPESETEFRRTCDVEIELELSLGLAPKVK